MAPAQIAADGVQRRRPAKEHGGAERQQQGKAPCAVDRNDAHGGRPSEPRRERLQRPAAERRARACRRRSQEHVLDEQLPQEPPRPAPMARRMPISRRRAIARASITAATFAQATTSSSVTAPKSACAMAGSRARGCRAEAGRIGETTLSLSRAVPDRRLVRAQEILRSLRGGQPRLQSSDAFVGVALALLIRIAGERQPHTRLERELGALREDADDLEDRVR